MVWKVLLFAVWFWVVFMGSMAWGAMTASDTDGPAPRSVAVSVTREFSH
jgi:hypothetical protein